MMSRATVTPAGYVHGRGAGAGDTGGMAAFTEQQIRSAHRSRALFTAAAVILAALASVHFAGGSDIDGAISGFAAVLSAASAVLASRRVGIMKRAVARDEVREPPKTRAEELAEAVESLRQRQWDAIAERAFLAAGGRERRLEPQRRAWDVSMVLDLVTAWNDVVRYEDVTGKPDGIAAGVIRVTPRTVRRSALTPGKPVVISWTVVTRAPSHGEGVDLLKAAEPLLREHLAELAHEGREARYFRVEGGALAEAPGCLASPEAGAGKRLAVAKAPVPQPDSGAVKLDPRWEWKRVQAAGASDRFVKVRCLHPEVVEVPSATDPEKVVAQLCLTCDTRFPAPVSGPADDWPAPLRTGTRRSGIIGA